MADKITYQDKEIAQASPLPTEKTWGFGDANEVKGVVNAHADEIDAIKVGGIVPVAVDGVTITGDGTIGDPLISTGGGGSGLTSAQTRAFGNTLQTGWIKGGNGDFATDANPAHFKVESGSGYISNSYADADSPTWHYITWPSFDNQSIPLIATSTRTFVMIEIDTITDDNNAVGKLFLKADVAPTSDELRDKILLFTISNITTVIDIFANNLRGSSLDAKLGLKDFSEAIGVLTSGVGFSANGANLKVDQFQYSAFKIDSNSFSDNKNPNRSLVSAIAQMEWTYIWRDPSLGFPWRLGVPNGDTDVNVLNYDDNTGPSTTVPLGVIGNNQYGYVKVFLFPFTNTAVFQYGQTTYANLNSAKAGVFEDSFENNPFVGIDADAFNAGFIIYKKSTANLTTAIASGEALILNIDRNLEGSASTGGSTNLQSSYNNSTPAEITTDTERGGLTIQIGLDGVNTDLTHEGKNQAGTTNFSVDGNGDVIANSFTGDGSGLTGIGGANISNADLTFDANHYVDLGAFSWTLNGTAPIGVDAMFSVQTNTEIKGLDDSSGTKVFHVINDSEESLLDIRGNGQTGINGLYGSGSALAVRNPNNEGQIAEFYNTDGSRSVIISANGGIQTFKSGTATTVFRARIFGSVPHLELFHPSLGQIVDLQSGASYISTTALTIGGTVSKVGAKFTLLQASATANQQTFFGNITTNTAGRTGSSGSFGADQKGFECFDTDLNKKFVWNGSAWEQITSA